MIKRFVGSEICYLWRFEWILGRKVDVQEEDAAFVDGTYDDIQVVSFIIKFKDFPSFFLLTRWTENRRHPLVQVITFGSGAAVRRRVERDLGKLLLHSLRGSAERLRYFWIRL